MPSTATHMNKMEGKEHDMLFEAGDPDLTVRDFNCRDSCFHHDSRDRDFVYHRIFFIETEFAKARPHSSEMVVSRRLR